MKHCIVVDCNGLVNAKSYCNSHYAIYRRYGDANHPVKRHIDATYPYLNHVSEYRTWADMKSRCQNKNHHAYKEYGGRGITVCDEWESFEAFYKDMGDRPASKSLDRRNNDRGYSPENCRWATRKQQQQNTRITVRNTSGYRGVFLDKAHPGRYRAVICIDGLNSYLGSYTDAEQAAIEHDKAVIFFRGDDGVTNIL